MQKKNQLINQLKNVVKNIDGNEVILNDLTLNNYENVCNFCTIYIVLFLIFFKLSICISSAYFSCFLKRDDTNLNIETTIY